MESMAMRFILTLLASILAAMTLGCASVNTATRDLDKNAVSKTFDKSYDVVWEAAQRALPDLRIRVVSADKTTHTITGSKGPSAFSWGERVALRVINEGQERTRVDVVSQRAITVNITGNDWTEEILQRIEKRLMRGAGKAWAPLEGNAIAAFANYHRQASPKAFAIADGGHWSSVSGRHSLNNEAVGVEAVEACTKRAFANCRLYAVNDELVDAP
jgi:hypothetical protein